ncbi:hypothetical protein [Hoylesella timonensis]|uniref:Uncharacterized protein n=1 Tax=Hoylesella timonensis CRIS 5C-B1 TaxID=679189 RepID=D1W0V2_9BACT|nr:hypothetical protein [Hoylesella timonensis]EFA97018.1 hypothetical protein HMPREF9019_1238 [Hoylesella timonensis CRIS 5C-B1]
MWKIYYRTYTQALVWLSLALTTWALTSCKDTFEEPEPVPPTLSVAPELTTDQLSIAFDVISYKGTFKVEDANRDVLTSPKIVIHDNHVKVELTQEFTILKITDATQLPIYLQIHCTHPDLIPVSYSIEQHYGVISYHDIKYGVGKNKIIEKTIRGDAAQVSINEKGLLMIKSLKPGTMSFFLTDSRGVVNFVAVSVDKGWDLTSNHVEVEGSPGELLCFSILFGARQWTLTEEGMVSPFNVVINDEKLDHSIFPHPWLQLQVPKTDKDKVVYQLENKDGHRATITIHIKAS